MARYGRWALANTSRVNEDLFGGSTRWMAYDIPLQIGRLVKNTGGRLKLSAEEIVQRHTLLPYYTALHDREAYERFCKQMLAGEQINRALKGAHTASPWPDRLRYCPQCDDVSRKQYGVPIWLRRHQLVTSLICLEHEGILLDSEVDITWERERIYKPASDSRTDARAVAFPWSERAMTQYRSITKFGHGMLQSQDDPGSWWPATDLRALARQKGFIAGSQLDMLGLIAELEHHYDEILQLWPRLRFQEKRRGNHWLHDLLGGWGFTTNPICWALTTHFLAEREDGSGATPGRRPAYRKPAGPPRPDLRGQARAAKDDEIIATEIRGAADRLRRNTPPSRITKPKLKRSVPGLLSLLRTYALPLTRVALIEEAEDRETFIRRQLKWMFEQASMRGEDISLAKLLEKQFSRNRAQAIAEWKLYYEGTEPSISDTG